MAEDDEGAQPSGRPFWSGRITIGLVNVPVKLYTMMKDQAFSFKLLHKQDGQPIRYDRVCIKDEKVVDWVDVVKGYEVGKNQYIVFDEAELKAARPESNEKIRLDKFVYFLSVDPIYFERSYILVPDKSEEAYSLLITAMQKSGKAGVGRITIRTKEYPALVHEYKGALVITTLRYANEVVNPSSMKVLANMKEPDKGELDLAIKIIGDLTGEFDITEYKDSFRKKIEELIKKKMKGETITLEKPKEEEIKKLMVALQETVKQLEKK